VANTSSSDYAAPLISKNPGNLGSQMAKASIGINNF
jgi:hypothetical protein